MKGIHYHDRSPDPDHKRSKRSKRRRRSPSTDSSESLSEEERRRKEKRKRRSGKDRSHHPKTSRKSRRHDDSEDDGRDRHRDHRRRSSTRSPQRQQTKSVSVEQTPPRSPDEPNDGEWVEKPTIGILMGPPPVPSTSSSAAIVSANSTEAFDQPADDDYDSESGVGPQPAPVVETRSNKRIDERQYGGALLRGEGSAMAAFLQEDTNVRIPRRGEIGLTSDEIANFEAVGYVMSGSRHKRMNAVRIRKENQVISAEEKRGILKLQKEERQRREAVLREEFQELVTENLKVAESSRKPSKS